MLKPDIFDKIKGLEERIKSLEGGNQNRNIVIPTGGKLTVDTESADPTVENGRIYYKSSTARFRGCQGGAWGNVTFGLENVDNTSDATKNSATVTLANKTLSAPYLTGKPTHTIVHGDHFKIQLPSANNGNGTGDATLYLWISEPGVTWTGAAIARNIVNTSGFPRVNTGLNGQMMRFGEDGEIYFSTITAGGTAYSPLQTSTSGIYIAGNCSALSFTDRTPFFEGDALAEIKKIKGDGKGGIDHTSLPLFAQKEIKHQLKQDKRLKKGDVQLNPVSEPGRDLGAMISILTVAVQQITDRLEKLEKKK